MKNLRIAWSIGFMLLMLYGAIVKPELFMDKWNVRCLLMLVALDAALTALSLTPRKVA